MPETTTLAPAPLSAPVGVTLTAAPADSAVKPVATSTPAAPATATETPKHTISVLPEDWQALNQQLAKLQAGEAARQAEIDAKVMEAARVQAEKNGQQQQFDEYKSAMERRVEEMRSKFDTQERENLSEKLNAVIAEALNSVKLVQLKGVDPATTAAQVRALLAPDIEAVRDQAGKIKVQDKRTFRPADQYLKERLNAPEFAVFIQPVTKGGGGANPNPSQQALGIEGARPGSLENIVAEWQSRQAQYASMGLRPVAK